MCGLVGIAGDTTGSWRDVFTDLLLIDSVRGVHSTGAGFLGRYDNKFTVVKRPGHPFVLFHTAQFDNAMDKKHPYKLLMGHNRHATMGLKTEENAHPFCFDNILGSHNGTLDKWSVPELYDHAKYGTDSEAIFATINKYDIKEALSRMSGAWALVWYDKRTKKLNFLRNDKRPLYYCYSKDRCTLIWASELEMLKYVMARNHNAVDTDEDGKPAYYKADPDILYSWSIPESISDKFAAPTQEENMEGRKWFSVTHAHPLTVGSVGDSKNTTGSTPSKTTTTTTRPPKNSLGADNGTPPFWNRRNTKKFRTPYKDQYGRVINKKEFTSIVDEGCAFCNANGQKWGEFIHILGNYCGYHTPYLCEDCYNDEERYEYVAYAI